MTQVGSELLNAPFPQMIERLGRGIAEAQFAMDSVSIKILQQLAGYVDDGEGNLVYSEDTLVQLTEGGEGYSLLALGFTPTFYQFVDTVIELKMAVSMNRSTETSLSSNINALFVASVNASYSQKYQYSVEGSSTVRTKIVTVPAPAVLEQVIQSELAAIAAAQAESGT